MLLWSIPHFAWQKEGAVDEAFVERWRVLGWLYEVERGARLNGTHSSACGSVIRRIVRGGAMTEEAKDEARRKPVINAGVVVEATGVVACLLYAVICALGALACIWLTLTEELDSFVGVVMVVMELLMAVPALGVAYAFTEDVIFLTSYRHWTQGAGIIVTIGALALAWLATWAIAVGVDALGGWIIEGGALSQSSPDPLEGIERFGANMASAIIAMVKRVYVLALFGLLVPLGAIVVAVCHFTSELLGSLRIR